MVNPDFSGDGSEKSSSNIKRYSSENAQDYCNYRVPSTQGSVTPTQFTVASVFVFNQHCVFLLWAAAEFWLELLKQVEFCFSFI